jgi:hypothetical protein
VWSCQLVEERPSENRVFQDGTIPGLSTRVNGTRRNRGQSHYRIVQKLFPGQFAHLRASSVGGPMRPCEGGHLVAGGVGLGWHT